MNTTSIPDIAINWIRGKRHEWEQADTPAEANMIIESLAGDYYAMYHRELTLDLEKLERQEAYDSQTNQQPA